MTCKDKGSSRLDWALSRSAMRGGDWIPRQRLLNLTENSNQIQNLKSNSELRSRMSESWRLVRDVWIRLKTQRYQLTQSSPLTEKMRLQLFGSRDLSGFPIDFASDRDTVYSRRKSLDYHWGISTFGLFCKRALYKRLYSAKQKSIEVSDHSETSIDFCFAEYSLLYRALLQKRPVIWRSLLIVATPYHPETSTFGSQLRSMQLHRLLDFAANSVELKGLWIWQLIE